MVKDNSSNAYIGFMKLHTTIRNSNSRILSKISVRLQFYIKIRYVVIMEVILIIY